MGEGSYTQDQAYLDDVFGEMGEDGDIDFETGQLTDVGLYKAKSHQ